ncbi:MAG: pyridoxal-phosphate dependent enzyme [Bacteroidota bacterium]
MLNRWQELATAAPSPVQQLHSPLLDAKGVKLWVKRDELLRIPTASGDLAFCGNKWRKLKYNLLAQQAYPEQAILTFGGAYSNHIAAVAAAGQLFGLTTIGVIRGERAPKLSTTLQQAEAHGMQLHFVRRTAYRQKQSTAFRQMLKEQFGDYQLIPEGGTNRLALEGVKELAQELCDLPFTIDYLACAVGTGGTLAGLIAGMPVDTWIEGFSSLKGDFLKGEVQELLDQFASGRHLPTWSINTQFHFGGYAKWDDTLLGFMKAFYDQFEMVLDPIYTGKLFYGIWEQIRSDYFPEGSNIVVLHTGGLQGIKGFNERFGTTLATH